MNFLFLSKLLPLFIYPLGLISSLLLLSLILWWKYPRWLPFPLILALLILFVAGNSWVSNLLVKNLEWQYIVAPEEIPNAEAIVILGGAIKSQIYPRPMVDVSESGDRIIYGAKLYKMGKAPLLIPTGGKIEWQGNKNNPSEADDIEELLILFDIPPSAIIKEEKSYNTHDNAVNTQKILQSRDIDRVILVTSALHMPRAVKVFEKQGIKVIPAPTDFLVSKQQLQSEPSWQSLIINCFPHISALHNITNVIKEYIGLLIYRFKGWA